MRRAESRERFWGLILAITSSRACHPFADDDPRTAEVVSKVLLLARDQEIQDPTILSQIAGR